MHLSQHEKMSTPRVLLLGPGPVSKVYATNDFDAASEASFSTTVVEYRSDRVDDDSGLRCIDSVVASARGVGKYVVAGFADAEEAAHSTTTSVPACMVRGRHSTKTVAGPMVFGFYRVVDTRLELVDAIETMNVLGVREVKPWQDPTAAFLEVLKDVYARERVRAVVWLPETGKNGSYDEYVVDGATRARYDISPFGAPIFKRREVQGLNEWTELVQEVPIKIGARSFRLVIEVDEFGRGAFPGGRTAVPECLPVPYEYEFVYGPVVLSCYEVMPLAFCDEDPWFYVDTLPVLEAFGGVHRSDGVQEVVEAAGWGLREVAGV